MTQKNTEEMITCKMYPKKSVDEINLGSSSVLLKS